MNLGELSIRTAIVRFLCISIAFGTVWGSAFGAEFSAGVAAYKRGDFTAAIAEFSALAETSDARAQFALGLLYDNGEGVVSDP
jgi:TPR repeat protein